MNGLLKSLKDLFAANQQDEFTFQSTIKTFPGCNSIGLTKPLLYDLYHPELIPVQQAVNAEVHKGISRQGDKIQCNPRGVLPGK